MSVLNAQELKQQASIVTLLHHLGYNPVPHRGRENMYHSMLREGDSIPSFAVNDDLGVWFDHGTGKGGNIIDFGMAYWPDLEFKEVVAKIQQVLSIKPSEPKAVGSNSGRQRRPVKIPNYVVEEIKAIGTHPAVTGYLKSRGIWDVAKRCLSEVYYYVEDNKGMRKHFFAAGWQNEMSGWEVRNKYFKGCLGHKAITFIPGDEKRAVLFEGFINYLSWKLENPTSVESVIVLNSLSMLKAGIGKAKAFSTLDLFFDRDNQGLAATRDFIKALPYATDRSARYHGFNDYNDKITAALCLPVYNASQTTGVLAPQAPKFRR
ncbi:toprim domain-containing protein [Mucilaginibacter terrae]|uniref:Zinc finger CHC2-type domain-containing protein n=1 Tax=Mucilaginibacter terrae TaxID=1955052 RepID=A0ABU3GNB9_9SPHI|nr:toprim domain-containing protein [Mucilaginibacter terrae]MDT3401266.1 hypothetical protein [Mucilaginibacter terrae]